MGGSMESIGELKKIIEKRHTKGVSSSTLYAKYIVRNISVFFTWVLLHTQVSANQVTVWQFIASLAGIACMAVPGTAWAVAGIIGLQMGYLLDNVDGEIARYRKTYSVNGQYLDLVNHLVAIPYVYMGLGLRYYFEGYGTELLILAIVGTLCQMAPSKRAIWSTIEYMSSKWETPAYHFKNLRSDSTGKTVGSGGTSRSGFKSNLDKIRRVLFGYPSSMNIYCLMLVLEIYMGEVVMPYLVGYFVFLGVFSIVWEVVSFRRSAVHNQAEAEYLKLIDNMKKSGVLED
jgi:phosphatidylglycerophosphate synthase